MDKDHIRSLISALDMKAYQFAKNYILGTEDTDYREWISEIKKQGADELYEIYNH